MLAKFAELSGAMNDAIREARVWSKSRLAIADDLTRLFYRTKSILHAHGKFDPPTSGHSVLPRLVRPFPKANSENVFKTNE